MVCLLVQERKYDHHIELSMAAQDGAKAIFTAAERGDVEEVKRLLDGDSGLLEARDEDHEDATLLVYAASEGQLEVVRLLLDRGAEVTARDADGDTALHVAALWAHEEVVAFLLSRGADASARRNDKSSALHYGSRDSRLGVVRLLLQHLRGRGLDYQDADRHTALWWASFWGHTEVARALLLAGADHTITGLHYSNGAHNEMTPLQAAQKEGHEDTVILFKVEGHPKWHIPHLGSMLWRTVVPQVDVTSGPCDCVCALLCQWWESELERGYVVHRARYHVDNFSKLQSYFTALAAVPAPCPVPAYLRPRLFSSLPHVETVASPDSGEEEQRGEGSGKREPAEQGEGEAPCEGEKQATLKYVMHDLAPELYIELMAGFH